MLPLAGEHTLQGREETPVPEAPLAALRTGGSHAEALWER